MHAICFSLQGKWAACSFLSELAGCGGVRCSLSLLGRLFGPKLLTGWIHTSHLTKSNELLEMRSGQSDSIDINMPCGAGIIFSVFTNHHFKVHIKSMKRDHVQPMAPHVKGLYSVMVAEWLLHLPHEHKTHDPVLAMGISCMSYHSHSCVSCYSSLSNKRPEMRKKKEIYL